MPTYEFRCEACSKQEERQQSIKDDSRPECCGKPMARTISSAPGFILKGQGWTGQEIKRAAQDDYIRDASRRAKEIKEQGRAAMDDVLTFSDVERMNPG